MSKYDKLWIYIWNQNSESMLLSFKEIKDISGFEIDHSFLNCKKELLQYNYEVKKISLKNQTILFSKIK